MHRGLNYLTRKKRYVCLKGEEIERETLTICFFFFTGFWHVDNFKLYLTKIKSELSMILNDLMNSKPIAK